MALSGTMVTALAVVLSSRAYAGDRLVTLGAGLRVRLGPEPLPGLEVFGAVQTLETYGTSATRFVARPSVGGAFRASWEGQDRLGFALLLRGGAVGESWPGISRVYDAYDDVSGRLVVVNAEAGVSARRHEGLGWALGGDLELGSLRYQPLDWVCGGGYREVLGPLGVSAHGTFVQNHVGPSVTVGVGPTRVRDRVARPLLCA